MKRMGIFIAIGLVLFAIGIAGGIFWGRMFAPSDEEGESLKAATPPGPIFPVGEFTANLAGAGNRIVSFSVSLELLNVKVDEALRAQNWLPRIRNEILLLVKDKVYEDMTKAEGVLQFAEQIRRVLNSILPAVNGEVPVVRVMFESFVMQ